MATTTMKDKHLIDPEVLGAFLDVKLMDAIKLSPLVTVDRTLQGRPGSKLTLPKYKYILEAQEIGENEAIEPVALVQSTVDVSVKKAGKAVEITDEAILSGYGDPVNEIGRQLLMAMADRIEMDLYAAIAEASAEVDPVTNEKEILESKYQGDFNKDVIVDAMIEFGEDIDEPMYLFVHPEQYAVLRKDADFVHVANGESVISGQVGRVHGCEVVVAKRVPAGEAFIMKEGALALIMKRNVMVEADRDILKATNVYAANEHYAVQLRYADRIVRIKKA